jgi:cytosine deaminase
VGALPRQLSLLRNATLPGGRAVDVAIDGALVTAVRPAGLEPVDADVPAEDAAGVLELDGFILLTAPAEPHAHLDKAFSWDVIDPPSGDLGLAIDSWRAYASTMTTEDVLNRARDAALALLRNGTTAVRSHVDLLDGDQPLRGVRALVALRAELSNLMDVELVALASHTTPDATIEAALDEGVDLVGGAPHLAPDPDAFLTRLLSIAERRDVGVDLHADEGLTGPVTLLAYARGVRTRAAGTSLSAGHCVRLGTMPEADVAAVLDEVLASDIGVIALPITNLYLQGWQHPVSTPRGLTAVRTLLERGVRLGAGGDNVRDPFNPVGRSDALETASLLVTAGHLTLEEAYRATAEGARSVLRLPLAGAEPGAKAEFLAVRGSSLSDVIANAPADRYVVHEGRLVSHSEVRHSTAASAAGTGATAARVAGTT